LPGLRRLRLEAALSQRDLATLAHLSPHTISDLEQQRVQARPSTMRKLAEVLNCSPRDLMQPPSS
jgi:transcriptional regulator with XRE-family HTH domain